jgi:FO synthase
VDCDLETLLCAAARRRKPARGAMISCSRKVFISLTRRTDEWLRVMRAAHRIGLRSRATIMFGHVDRYEHWGRHILRIRELQEETGGFTEFVPLPFVHMEAPIYLKGRSRRGPTFREAVLMHAIGRLALHPLIVNIQTSWVMGHEGVKTCLCSGANDLGGTLMDESITHSAARATDRK